MSGETRAYLIIILMTLAAVAAFGKTIEHWTLGAIFGALEVGAIALSNGLQKAPREAAAQDDQGEAKDSGAATS